MSNLGNKKIMSENLQRYILRSGKDRRVICEDLGFSYSTFNDWVSGRVYPRIDKIEILANYFGISKSDLIEEKTINTLKIPHELTGVQIAFYEGTKDLSEEDLKALIPIVAALKDKK